MPTNLSLKMTVITRNQAKNINNKTMTEGEKFTKTIQTLLSQCELAVSVQNKTKVVLKIYQTINNDLYKILQKEGVNKWIKFVCTCFYKILEFEDYFATNDCSKINRKLLEAFKGELCKAKEFIVPIISNYQGFEFADFVNKTKKTIADMGTRRSSRNILRVNYTGMDTIEPESESDKITDIWADKTFEKDPDYEFDEDEDEDEEDDEEEKPKWAKIHPELSTNEKTEMKQYITKLADNQRARRNVPRVNYAGMDMNEDDDGKLHVPKRRFEDGRVKYIWQSYSLSEANEIGDENYVDEE